MKVDPTQEEIELHVQSLTSHFQKLVESWKQEGIGSMASWMGLFQSIMQKAQLLKSVPGLRKADICLDVIAGIANALIESNPEDVDLTTVKMILTDEGMGILKGTTSVIKDLIRGMDKDGDQEVSMDELKDFFCGCCSLKKAKKK